MLGERKFAIAPGASADYGRLFRELSEQGLHPHRVVHCWTLMNPPVAAVSIEAFWQQQTLGYFSLLSLAKALAAQTNAGERSLVVVTRQTYKVGTEDGTCNLANATMPGLCKIMSQELSGVRCTLLDLSGNDNADSWEPSGIEAERILAEAAHNSSEPVVAYRGGLRLVQMLHEQELSTSLPMVRDLRERGLAIIVLSTEPETVLSLADRIIVLKRGSVVREFANEAISKDRLLEAA